MPQKHIRSFDSILATVIRWVPQHPLMHQADNEDFSLLVLSGGVFFSVACRPTRRALNNGYDDPVKSDELSSQSAVSFAHFAKASHNLTAHITPVEKSHGVRLGGILRTELGRQTLHRYCHVSRAPGSLSSVLRATRPTKDEMSQQLPAVDLDGHCHNKASPGWTLP